MNFMQAFSETLGKEQPATPSPTQPTQTDTTRTGFDDDMKAYIDAKFEALKSDLLADMTQPGPKVNEVETPEETDNILRPEEQQAQESLNNTIENK